ncbi:MULTISPECIES: 16S rRNA (uracil(1498)-N(3))-methyltransferase [unclassified Aureimonas]|uniref:16S rRNA (uracil(1498)-N(3))-methyltransferase n=1 Tax=unclassified Aureimonas TaxID=2615206 RepID=UPI0006FFAAAB|nr:MULTISPECIES: 16S rRNA (uracil(1498)-N(3))-methyltransferase [unclassified Aureimonas]KQT69770.1 16S rRNA methyltransferase [Aureimonas sp. Leaf427]KQT76078.1 16S rRNA methyltransferase [Aureimonas sp. Leaf460]
MPDHDFKSPRLHVAADLSEGMAIEAEPAQANYLQNVLRLGAGDTVLLFNGRDGEWRAELVPLSKKRLTLRPLRRLREQVPAGDLHYLFAPLKQARLDYMVQKAVEMGAGRLQAVLTQHVQAPRVNLDRIAANAVEAAEQCGILALPEIAPTIRLAEVLANFDAGRSLVFCDERAPEGSAIEALKAAPRRPISLLIGPEGGFSEPERALLLAHPATLAISLGPRILRADTAAVAALAVVQASVGDWSDG